MLGWLEHCGFCCFEHARHRPFPLRRLLGPAREQMCQSVACIHTSTLSVPDLIATWHIIVSAAVLFTYAVIVHRKLDLGNSIITNLAP